MVGVPGKSAGCNTCRRRKVGCDKEKPTCKRCRSSGRQCEGYEKYPVFLIKTQDGPMRRRRLEEVKSKSPPDTDRASNNSSRAEDRTTISTSRSPDSSAVWNTQLAGHFWNSITATNARFNNDIGLVWLKEILQTPDPSQALRLSLTALCATRVAWATNDEGLAMHGRQIYSQALRSIQNALNDPNLMLDDHTFGAARTLVTYEVFESTTDDPSAWKRHIHGLSQLVRARGPNRYTSVFARAGLEDARDSMMICALIERKRSFLLDPEWLNKPWSDSAKDNRQLVCDVGLSIAAMCEEFDRACNLKTLSDVPDLISILRRCLHLNHAMNQLGLENFDATSYASEIEYSDIQSAMATMHAFTLKQSLSMLADPICARLWNVKAVHQDAKLIQMVNYAKTEFNDKTMLENGRKIVASARFCLRPEFAAVGSRRVIFPLAGALYQFVTLKAPDLQECAIMYRDLTTKRGVRFAKNVGRGVSARYDELNRHGPTGLTTGLHQQ